MSSGLISVPKAPTNIVLTVEISLETGTATARTDPQQVDVLLLVQALLSLCAQYTDQARRATSMIVGQNRPPAAEKKP